MQIMKRRDGGSAYSRLTWFGPYSNSCNSAKKSIFLVEEIPSHLKLGKGGRAFEV